MTRKSPQEKKRLSRAKDRRNDYGENDKSSRKNIPRSKALQRRKYRRKLRVPTDVTGDIGPQEPTAAALVRKRGWRKTSDVPLGEHIERQQQRRKRRK